jgi:hypothetical protein
MQKNLKRIIDPPDEQERGESSYTRLLKEDDRIVRERPGKSSLIIADLVHKGLLYEALQKGTGDPAIRNLLRTFDGIIQHRVEEATKPIIDALQPLADAVCQNRLFTAALFLTIAAKLTYPLENKNGAATEILTQACMPQANDMVNLVMDALESQPQPVITPEQPMSQTLVTGQPPA